MPKSVENGPMLSKRIPVVCVDTSRQLVRNEQSKQRLLKKLVHVTRTDVTVRLFEVAVEAFALYLGSYQAPSQRRESNLLICCLMCDNKMKNRKKV
jgi:hypothetical protein